MNSLSYFFFCFLSFLLCRNINAIKSTESNDVYEIGVGIADITGPAAEINMMGYAKMGQDTSGIHFRLFSRAFIIQDHEGKRICYVSADLAMVDMLVKLEVVQVLKKKYNGLYTEENVMIAGTHTHSGPGGFLQYVLYIITSQGFIFQNFYAIVDGIVRSIDIAHSNMVKGHIYYNEGELLNASINRSPTAYANNPSEERERYEHNTDKTMYLLKFSTLSGVPIGAITWFAVHPTSMNNTNRLISGDNKGYASLLFEQDFNVGQLLGKGPFVAAFPNANLGDVSPNLKGPHCADTGLPCDNPTSTCGGHSQKCYSLGPGSNMFESTKIIAERQYLKAKELFLTAKEKINGSVSFIHQYVDMSNVTVLLSNGSIARTCKPAMGYSFAAGTTDGPGAFDFKQGSTTSNSFWNLVRDALSKPTQALIKCHEPKPILLATGQMHFPYDWQPKILPTQLLKIGDVFIAGVPAEFSTMSGRRMKEALRNVTKSKKVILSGLSNAYSSYVTTFEEYQIQRYEGASTIFGPHTLNAYIQQFMKLARNLLNGSEIELGPTPPNLLSKQISLKPGVVFDSAPYGHKFGDCILNAKELYTVGSTVTVKFISGHPRNNLMTEKSFLTVEYFDETHSDWQIIATDTNWETKFIWERTNSILGHSQVTIIWEIPKTAKPGLYKIYHFGYHKNIFQQIKPYFGETKAFNVSNRN
ncbi:neutral ceramidase-like protein [Dinothrombium tinctorium]|uniref:Neutral ceramidase n=1 Tax=Dinothrombium tinctorium TaxID=1965070 RepID=A0A3S4QT21_9ACAR|nr:neutral ceramidase-like protein [Dinothrombium tinctorium]RWS07459.1 neutral ceramidase-like protein [Dinothrombium tinctorium]